MLLRVPARPRARSHAPVLGEAARRLLVPLERVAFQASQHEPVEQGDEQHEQEYPAHEAGVAQGVVPEPGPPADARGGAEPLHDEQAVPSGGDRQPHAGEGAGEGPAQEQVEYAVAARHVVRLGHLDQRGVDAAHAGAEVDGHERDGGQHHRQDRGGGGEAEPQRRQEGPYHRGQRQQHERGVVEQPPGPAGGADQQAQHRPCGDPDGQADGVALQAEAQRTPELADEHAAVGAPSELGDHERDDLLDAGDPVADHGEVLPDGEQDQEGDQLHHPRPAQHPAGRRVGAAAGRAEVTDGEGGELLEPAGERHGVIGPRRGGGAARGLGRGVVGPRRGRGAVGDVSHRVIRPRCRRALRGASL